MEKWRLKLTVKIPAGTHLKNGGSQAVCENAWSTINSIENCKASCWKIERLIFNREYVEFDLLCDHYKLKHGPNEGDVNSRESMQFEIDWTKRCFGVPSAYLARYPDLKPEFSNELIEKYEGEN